MYIYIYVFVVVGATPNMHYPSMKGARVHKLMQATDMALNELKGSIRKTLHPHQAEIAEADNR